MTDAPRVPTACDGCGQTDDHPKVLTWGPWQKDDRTSVSDASFHFDCLPPQFEDLHGDKLLAFIEKQPSDNDIEVS
jgi:hypothetical protein